jgi:hypothetical protein
VFNNLIDVGTLEGKKDFFLFEEGVEPDWDHPGNAMGGLWLLHCSQCLGSDELDEKPTSNQSLDSLWRHTVCTLFYARFLVGALMILFCFLRACVCIAGRVALLLQVCLQGSPTQYY